MERASFIYVLLRFIKFVKLFPDEHKEEKA